jgi:hypothetical protein
VSDAVAWNDGGKIHFVESGLDYSGGWTPGENALHGIGHHWDREYDKDGWWALLVRFHHRRLRQQLRGLLRPVRS